MEQSQEEVAAKRLARIRAMAVQADTEPRLLAAARWLRRRIPGDDRFGDPLSTAGGRPSDMLARQVTALQRERPSVAHELGLGALQLWQGLSEGVGRGRGEEEITLLFTDLVGFSSWALDAGDEAAVELLRVVGEILEDAVTEHHGAIVKHLGDGAMAVFESPRTGVAAALDARDAIADVEVAGHNPELRSGIHCGKPRRLGGDYLGVDVNIAARIVDAAKPQQVLVSEAACQDLGEDGFDVGKAKRLRAPGAPKELRVAVVERGQEPSG